jgi:hypothetical protein
MARAAREQTAAGGKHAARVSMQGPCCTHWCTSLTGIASPRRRLATCALAIRIVGCAPHLLAYCAALRVRKNYAVAPAPHAPHAPHARLHTSQSRGARCAPLTGILASPPDHRTARPPAQERAESGPETEASVRTLPPSRRRRPASMLPTVGGECGVEECAAKALRRKFLPFHGASTVCPQPPFLRA